MVLKAIPLPLVDHALGPEEIIDHCRQTLAGYKYPKRVTFVDSLPTTAIGKISRKNVKEVVR